jgi:hypothetical protein
MSSRSSRLSLHRETVRELTGESLSGIAGGAILTPVVNTVPLGNCITPIFFSASSCCPAADGGCNSAASGCGAGC